MKKNKIYFNDIEYCPYHPKGLIKKYKKNPIEKTWKFND